MFLVLPVCFRVDPAPGGLPAYLYRIEHTTGRKVTAGISIGVRERVLEFLSKYGEKGYMVLKAAVEASVEGGNARRGVRLGDFSYREVVSKLKSYGVEYNPALLLSKLEKEYGVIETSYRSSGQHWWRFIDLDAVINALDEYERGVQQPIAGRDNGGTVELETMEGDATGGFVDDPQVEVIRAQIAALAPHELLQRLRMLASKPRLSSYDRRLFAKIAFEELELVAQVLEKARAYPEYFEEEIRVLENILRLASLVARKLLPGTRVGLKRSTVYALERAMT